MPQYTEKENFSYRENVAVIPASADDVQRIINHFKTWLPRANAVYKQRIEKDRREAEEKYRGKIEREKELLNKREKVLKETKI